MPKLRIFRFIFLPLLLKYPKQNGKTTKNEKIRKGEKNNKPEGHANVF